MFVVHNSRIYMVHNSKIWVRWGYMVFSNSNRRGKAKFREIGEGTVVRREDVIGRERVGVTRRG